MEYLFTYISPVNLMVSMKVNRPGTQMTRVFITKGLVLEGWSRKIEDIHRFQVYMEHVGCRLFRNFQDIFQARLEFVMWICNDHVFVKQFGMIAWTHCWHSSPLPNWVYFDISLVHWQKTLEWIWLHMYFGGKIYRITKLHCCVISFSKWKPSSKRPGAKMPFFWGGKSGVFF